MQLTDFEIHTAHFKDFTGREAIYYSLKFKYFSCNLVLLFSTCNTSNQLQLHQLQFTTLATQTTSEAASEIYKYAPLATLICCTVSNPTLHARLPSIKYIRFSVESAVHWPATGLHFRTPMDVVNSFWWLHRKKEKQDLFMVEGGGGGGLMKV